MGKADSTSPPAKCHFLSVPKGTDENVPSIEPANNYLEIRLMIYRLLLLKTSTLRLSSGTKFNIEDDWDDTDDDEDVDVGRDVDSLDGSDSDADGNNPWFGIVNAAVALMTEFEDDPHSAKTHMAFKNHPAILRANRQIYAEASSVLYTEGVFAIDPRDIFSLSPNPWDLEFGVGGNIAPWKYKPLESTWKEDNGIVTYDSPELGGLLYPHVFARFQKIFFDAYFGLEHTHHVDLWIDDDTYIIRADTAEKYQSLLRSSTIMKDFVKLISHNPLISKLTIRLDVEVLASSNLLEQISNEDEDSNDEDYTERSKFDKVTEKANERATELFLESNIFEPLLQLENVRTFDLEFEFLYREPDNPYKPLPRHVKLVKEMKEIIEGRFKEPIASE